MSKRFLPYLLYFLLTAPVLAQMTIEVIPLNHRTVDQVIPVISPLVSDGGTVTGMNNQLIVKTSPENLAQIRMVLASLDKPARRLLITVRQDITGSSTGSGYSTGARYNSGDVSISADGNGNNERGARIGVRDHDGNLGYLQGNSTRSAAADNNDFRVQTLEGQPAFIQTGSLVPVANRNTWVTRDGVVVQDSVEYLDATSGFYVIAGVNGDLVTLQVSPNMTRQRQGKGAVFDVQNIETRINGRLGEWLQLGGIDQSNAREDGSLLNNTRRKNSENRTVLIKVDEIH